MIRQPFIREREAIMSVAKTIEIIASSKDGIEAAIRDGIAKASESVEGIESAWVQGTQAIVSGNRVTEWRVQLKVTFLVK
jgi:flavin-binding protein dodecin